MIIEPVDSRAAGRTGQRSAGIYFTNLFNKALPIIRYYIDDIFEMGIDGPAMRIVLCESPSGDGRTLDNFQYGRHFRRCRS